MKNDIACIQRKIGVTPDGIVGPQTVRALKQALGLPQSTTPLWPTQAEVRSGKSMFGAPGCEHELTALVPPYPLYFDGEQVRTIRVHRLIALHVKEALSEVLTHYGQAEIRRLGLDIYGGSYNYRSSTGSSALSMHAWGLPSTSPRPQTPTPRAPPELPSATRIASVGGRYGKATVLPLSVAPVTMIGCTCSSLDCESCTPGARSGGLNYLCISPSNPDRFPKYR